MQRGDAFRLRGDVLCLSDAKAARRLLALMQAGHGGTLPVARARGPAMILRVVPGQAGADGCSVLRFSDTSAPGLPPTPDFLQGFLGVSAGEARTVCALLDAGTEAARGPTAGRGARDGARKRPAPVRKARFQEPRRPDRRPGPRRHRNWPDRQRNVNPSPGRGTKRLGVMRLGFGFGTYRVEKGAVGQALAHHVAAARTPQDQRLASPGLQSTRNGPCHGQPWRKHEGNRPPRARRYGGAPLAIRRLAGIGGRARIRRTYGGYRAGCGTLSNRERGLRRFDYHDIGVMD